jgi:hypothetical protein
LKSSYVTARQIFFLPLSQVVYGNDWEKSRSAGEQSRYGNKNTPTIGQAKMSDYPLWINADREDAPAKAKAMQICKFGLYSGAAHCASAILMRVAAAKPINS